MGIGLVLVLMAALPGEGAQARRQRPIAAGEVDAPAPAAAPTVPAVAPADVPASKRAATPPGPTPLPADLPAHARFVVVELHDEVNLGMAAFVERVAGGLSAGDILVLDINTFGGRVDAAVTIRDALLHTHDVGAKTIAFINPRAISAGALISFATDIIVVAPASTMGAATPVTIGDGGKMEPVEEKVVSYMRQEMRATAEARGRSGDIAEAMVDADREVDGLDDAGKLLTLDGKLLLSWGVASFEANDLDELVRDLGYGGPDGKTFEVVRVQWSWAEVVAGWLSSSIISGLLMTIGMLGLMIGLYTGGSPLPLGLGGACLALFFFGHTVVNLAGVEDILLFAAGLVLLGVEVFVPGHILPGILGVLCILAALVLGLIDFDKVDFAVQWHAGYISRAVATVFGSVLATAVLGYAAFRVLPSSRFGRGLILSTAIDARSTDDTDADLGALVGQVGTADSDLRPSGKVMVGGRRVEAVAERGYIARGTAISVVRREGFHVVVAAVKGDSKGEQA